MTTAELIAIIKPLLDRLRKYMKNKEVFDIVHEIEANQRELESKTSEADSQIQELNAAHAAEITRLEQEHAAEITNLKSGDAKKKFHHPDLPEIQARILLFIAQHEIDEIGVDTSEIAHRVSVAKEAIPFHLHELEAADFIESSSKFDIPMWYMKHEGRRYLFERGLIK